MVDRVTTTTKCGGMLVLLALAGIVPAQEIEPRAYSNIPEGVNFGVVGFVHAQGGLATNPTLPLDDADLSTDVALLGFARGIAFRGQSGKVDLVLPYAWLEGSAVFAGEPLTRRVTGLGDPRVRVSINLLGAPALALRDFAGYRQDTIVGVSLQASLPLGQYDSTRLVNIGTNRWWIKPDVGVSKSVGRWTFELAGGVTLFGDNEDFRGDLTRSQDPLYSVQGGVIYGWPRGTWIALHGTHYTGGRSTVDGVEGDDLQRNSELGFTASFPLGRKDSVKFYASNGLSTRIGTDVDTVSLAWQHRWGGGF